MIAHRYNIYENLNCKQLYHVRKRIKQSVMKIGQDIIAKKAIWFAILANNESLLLKPYRANPQYKQKLSTYPR